LGRRPSQTEFEQAREVRARVRARVGANLTLARTGFEQVRERHERELAKMRFEREMLEEKVRP